MEAFEFRSATEDDVLKVLTAARQENIDELQLIDGLDLVVALRDSLRLSKEAYVAVIGGEVVATFGVVPTNVKGVGRPWMVGTSRIDQHAKTFLRLSKQVIYELSARWPVLQNVADARNVRGLRWLRFMGFTIYPAVPLGDHGLPFHLFELRG